MTKEDTLLLKHFEDLSRTAYQKGIPVYSGFLTLYEQSLLTGMSASANGACRLYSEYALSGGYDYAERKMACFYDGDMPSDIPYSILNVKAAAPRFAEELSHRDYLGALMNLGIDREVLGDIVKESSHSVFIICKAAMADYICDNYVTVKHTAVVCNVIPNETAAAGQWLQPHFEEITGSVSSLRLDCVLALAFRRSRTQISELIETGNVFVNSRLIMSGSYQLKKGDTVSARGFGKFIFADENGLSKKGKYYITLQKYT